MQNYFEKINSDNKFARTVSHEDFERNTDWINQTQSDGGARRTGVNKKFGMVVHEWKINKDFDIKKILENMDEPLIEVAGPTPKGYYHFLELKDLNKEIFVSNFKNPVTYYDGSILGELDFQADAQELPFKNGSVGAVFCSCIAPFKKNGLVEDQKEKTLEFRRKVVKEALRVLKRKGFLIFSGLFPEDVHIFDNIGFGIKQFSIIESFKSYKEKLKMRNGYFILEKE